MRKVVAVTILFFLVAFLGFADGIFIPPRVVSRVPGIPNQRGLIVYRDGIEKLVVESAFQGEGAEMAWIIPVPNKPTEIAQASSGLFTTIEMALQPAVHDGPKVTMLIGCFLIIWALFLMAAGRFVPARALLMALVVLFIICFGMAEMSPLGRASEPRPSIPGVKTSDAVVVGNYDVQVLEAATPSALNQWLSGNSFREMPPEAEPVVADYIAKNWRFVAARLRREGESLAKAHPLMLTFPAEAPVYPMRLTRFAGSNLHLELAVISDRQAKVAGMQTVFTDSFSQRNDLGLEKIPFFASDHFYAAARFALPSLMALMSDHCVITRLSGDFVSKDLKKDFVVKLRTPKPAIETVYTSRGGPFYAADLALLIGGGLLLIGTLVHFSCERKNLKAPGLLRVILASCLCAECVYGVALWTAKKGVFEENRHESRPSAIEWTVETLRGYPELLSKMTVKDIEQYFMDALKEKKNPYTGEPFRIEETPGGIVIVQDEHGIVARTFGASPWELIGRPVDLRITGKTDPGHPDK